jgi:hypothetical protein
MMRKPGGPSRKGDGDPLSRFLAYLRDIELALASRDPMRVTALLRKRTATHLPREVREELLMLSRSSRDSLRAPMQFLRFQHRMTELADGGERLPTAQTELRLEAPPPRGSIRRRALEERRPAASDSIDVVREDD